MATPIKTVPILSGKLADESIRQAKENKRRPRHPLTEEQEERVAKFVRQLKEYVPSWKR